MNFLKPSWNHKSRSVTCVVFDTEDSIPILAKANVSHIDHERLIAVDRMQLLKKISFGARVAKDETNELGNYFVETDQWDRIFNGEIDVIKGDKGAGKSAIYSLLSAKSNELFDKRILLITAEEPRGTPVFKELVTEPPAAEAEFVGLW